MKNLIATLLMSIGIVFCTFSQTDEIVKEPEVFKKVDEMPRFPGCEDLLETDKRKSCSQTKMLQYIYSTLRYPAEARSAGIEGMVVIQFTVETDGSIQDAYLKTDIGGGCGEAGMAVVESMNSMSEKWMPGKQDGVPVAVLYTIPIKFKLEGGSSKSKRIKKESKAFTILEVDFVPILSFCEEQFEDEKQRQKCTNDGFVDYLQEGTDEFQFSVERIEGSKRILIDFGIDRKGSITKYVRIIGATKEQKSYLVRRIRKMEKSLGRWIPGELNGQDVDVDYQTEIFVKTI